MLYNRYNRIESSITSKGRDNMPLPKHKKYTIDDIFALPEGKRAELIDGQIYNMAPPSPFHQKLSDGTFCHYTKILSKRTEALVKFIRHLLSVVLNQTHTITLNLIFPLSAILPTWMPEVIRVPPILLLKSYHQAVNAWIIWRSYSNTRTAGVPRILDCKSTHTNGSSLLLWRDRRFHAIYIWTGNPCYHLSWFKNMYFRAFEITPD